MDEKQLIEQMEYFLAAYEDSYDEDALDFIRENYLEYYKKGIRIDIIDQALVAIDLLPDDVNLYKRYLEFLKERYSLDQDILEVGCGRFPAFSKYVDNVQSQTGKGTITAYDPDLITTTFGNIKLYKKAFDENTKISDYSLITSVRPCEATLSLIQRANEEDKDFSILTCGCTHFPPIYLDYYRCTPTREEWRHYLIERATKNLPKGRTIDIDFIKGTENPIISSRKKQKIIK